MQVGLLEVHTLIFIVMMIGTLINACMMWVIVAILLSELNKAVLIAYVLKMAWFIPSNVRVYYFISKQVFLNKLPYFSLCI